MSAVTVLPPKEDDLHHKAARYLPIAESIAITDDQSYEMAARYLLAVKALMTEADEIFDPIVRKAHEAHKEALAGKKKVCEPLSKAEEILKRLMGAYVRLQEQKRLEEERRRREESERLALEARELEIEDAEASGAALEEVQALANAPVFVPPVVVTGLSRISGIGNREIWKAEVTDLHALVKFIAANPLYIGMLQANTSAINALARSMKTTMKVPGVRVWAEANIAAARRSY